MCFFFRSDYMTIQIKRCLKLVNSLVTASEIMHFPLKLQIKKSPSKSKKITILNVKKIDVHLSTTHSTFLCLYLILFFFPQAKAFCLLHSFFVLHIIDPQIWYIETGHCVTHEWIHNLIMRFSS